MKSHEKIVDKIYKEHQREKILEGLLVNYSAIAINYSQRNIPLVVFDQRKASIMKQIKELFK